MPIVRKREFYRLEEDADKRYEQLKSQGIKEVSKYKCRYDWTVQYFIDKKDNRLVKI